MKNIFIILLLTNLSLNILSQDNEDTIKTGVTTPVIIVTATKTEKDIDDVSVPADIILQDEIKRSGSVRLNEILGDQTGLLITNFLGSGIQMQGLDPDYTLILIDGEPAIGRMGGTLELSRFSLSNVKRIEIIKGPSSSLYGSEALAGVINIITENPLKPFGFIVKGRYGTYDAADISADIEYRKKGTGFFLSMNRNSSSGYDLNPGTEPQTAPPYYNYSISPKAVINLTQSSRLSIAPKIYYERIDNLYQFADGNELVTIDDKTNLLELSLNVSYSNTLSEKLKITGKLYGTRYNNKNDQLYRETGVEYFKDYFDQYFAKAEVQADWAFVKNNVLTWGAGYIIEKVTADRIYDGKRTSSSVFGYIQDEWSISKKLSVVGGTRFDNHSDYTSRLSPKISVIGKPFDFISLKASAGSGFKAPSFQQLYLNFTNPLVGYSVYGSYGVKESFQKLIDEGQIQDILIPVNSIEPLNPESSIAFNAGIDLKLFSRLKVSANFFRNNLKDLIETTPIAIKTNGQRVFSYININKVYTEGVEAELDLEITEGMNFIFGYQYLNAVDEQVLEDIRAGKILKTGKNGVLRQVYEQEYGGLFNRAKHSGNFKLNYSNIKAGLMVSLRGNITGRTGYADLNSNGILDNDNEYIPGYGVWSFSIAKDLYKHFTVQFMAENIFNKTDYELLPSVPGRIFYGSISYCY